MAQGRIAHPTHRLGAAGCEATDVHDPSPPGLAHVRNTLLASSKISYQLGIQIQQESVLVGKLDIVADETAGCRRAIHENVDAPEALGRRSNELPHPAGA